MFNRARNVVVKGSSLTVHSNTFIRGGLDRLLDEVAPNAILNAGGRPDEVRCYPGTRAKVIGRIEDWMDGKGSRQSGMMWLSGPAGAGKSAILQTIAERCEKRGLPSANFFFFRDDHTRNHSAPLVPTLLYQLLERYPALNKLLTDRLTTKPLIFKAPVEQQLEHLISPPIRNFSSQPILLLIDGLDECEDKGKQEQILVALHSLVEASESQFLVLVGSRAEPHLRVLFNKLGTSAQSMFLDDMYEPRDDIRHFVAAKFSEIKGAHHLAHTLDAHWPSDADIDGITDKSSGQFIYAATVMRYIQNSTASPALSLIRVHDVRPPATSNPFAQLDAVYSYILSKADDIQRVKFLLGIHLIVERGIHIWGPNDKDLPPFHVLLRHVGYGPVEIESLFSGLEAIVSVTATPLMEIALYHASMSDYLEDQTRSGIYHVDIEAVAAELASIYLTKMNDPGSWGLSLSVLGYVNKPTPELSKSLLNAAKQMVCHGEGDRELLAFLIREIDRLYFEVDNELFKRMLRRWVRFAYINNIGMAQGRFRRRDFYMQYNWYSVTEGVKFALKSRI